MASNFGSSAPPIVFVSQLGVGGEAWGKVLDQLGDLTSFTYDRPGTGAAPGRPKPNPPLSLSAFANELASRLEVEGLFEAAVVVGHSFGGNIARVYAGLYPQQVAGLVFVDSSIPQMFLEPGRVQWHDGDGPGATEIDTVRSQVEIMNLALPKVPAIVLSRTPGAWDGEYDPPHPAVEDLWIASQRTLAQQCEAPLIVTDNCGHQIPRDNPALVAYAVREAVEAARANRRRWPKVEQLALLGAHLDDGQGTDLPVGSIVAFHDSVAYRDDEHEQFPWSETSAGAYSDSYVREMLDGGYAVLVRHGFDGAPPEPPVRAQD